MENLTIFLLKDIQPKPTPFLRMMLVMMRVTFQKCNNGSAKVGLLIRDMEGTMF
jgi:vacuolar protein sorting-associated protein 13A/C